MQSLLSQKRILSIIPVFLLLLTIPITVYLVNNSRDSRSKAQQTQIQTAQILEDKMVLVVLKYDSFTKKFSLESKMNLYSTPEPVEPLQESNPQSYKVFVYDQNNKVVYETSLTADQDQPESYFDVKVPLGDHYQLVILDQTEKKVFEESL